MAPRRDPSDRPARSWRLGLSWLFGVLVLAAVVLVASKFTEIKRFAEIARAAQPAWLLAALALQVLTYFCAAGVWYGALHRAGVRRSYWSIVPLGLAKLFADQALPTGGIGGTVLVVSGLDRRGVPSGVAMAALLIGLISFYIAYLMVVLSGLAILYGAHALNRTIIVAAAAFIVVAFGIPAIVLRARHWSQHGTRSGLMGFANRWLERMPGFSSLKSAMAKAPGELLGDPLPFVSATVLQLLIFALDAGTLWVMLHALGAKASPTTAFAAFVMAQLASTVGPMPLGLGTFEAVCVTILHVLGQSVEVALTATLLLRGFTFWLPMIPGLVLARRELKHSGRQSART